jgi:hypothetical protein
MIDGPIRYAFLEPIVAATPPYPNLVLLGDWHSTQTCGQTCDDSTCVTLYDSKRRTFLQHVDDAFGDQEPDVYRRHA